MKAIVYEKYGPPNVLEWKEVPKPTPKDDELLIELRATTVSSADARMRAMNVPKGFGLLSRLALGVSGPRQKILGMEFSGVVVGLGKKVKNFKVGASVFGMTNAIGGCYAEFRTFPAGGAVVEKPAKLTFEEAAALCFGGTTALDFIRRGKLCSGERILINGASGSVGTAAVQLAKHFGAHVTAVCSSANFDLLRSLGADAVIDYRQEDFTSKGETYDLIMDTAGTAPFVRCEKSLSPGGRLLLVLGNLPDTLASLWINLRGDKKVVAGVASVRVEDVRLLGELAETGIYKPIVDRSYPLERAAEAHSYVDQGHKKGNVVLTLGRSSSTNNTNNYTAIDAII